MLQAFMTLFANADPSRGSQKLVLKFTAWDLLSVKQIHDIWPTVPMLIIIRDPVEVAVSNVENPPPWIREKCRFAKRLRTIFSVSDAFLLDMAFEEYVALVVGAQCKAALSAVGMGCRVVDYGDLNSDAIIAIADWFSLDIASKRDMVVATSLRYSKDGRRGPFVSDSVEKRERASSEIVNVTEKWARQPYKALRGSAARWLHQREQIPAHYCSGKIYSES